MYRLLFFFLYLLKILNCNWQLIGTREKNKNKKERKCQRFSVMTPKKRPMSKRKKNNNYYKTKRKLVVKKKKKKN